MTSNGTKAASWHFTCQPNIPQQKRCRKWSTVQLRCYEETINAGYHEDGYALVLATEVSRSGHDWIRRIPDKLRPRRRCRELYPLLTSFRSRRTSTTKYADTSFKDPSRKAYHIRLTERSRILKPSVSLSASREPIHYGFECRRSLGCK